MKTISIRELHNRTGHYVRAATREPLAVTERGQPIARLVPTGDVTGLTRFADRRLRPGFKRLQNRPFPTVDSGKLVSEDRDRA